MTENIVASKIEKFRTAISEQIFRSTLFNLPRKGTRTLFLENSAKAIFSALATGEALRVGDGVLAPAIGDIAQFSLIANLNDQMICDHGLSSLYCGLGMIEWSDTEAAKPKAAPLVLVPLKAVGSAITGFSVIQVGAPVLNEPLMRHLSVQRSAIPPDEPLAFVPKRSHARIKSFTDQAAIGLFSMVRSTLADRLEEAFAGTFANHPLVTRLLTPSNFAPETQSGDCAYHKDPHLPCDSAQLLALRSASAGQNLVVHGPPGTGKTQTITNILADLLDQEKRVLLMSEATAALEPIFSRLGTNASAENTLNICAGFAKDPRGNHGRLNDLREDLGRLSPDARPALTIATSAAYLAAIPAHWTFDAVIIDEASRMRLSYAVPALSAARQVIIVGDHQQCGPSMIIQLSQDGSVSLESDMSVMDAGMAAKLPAIRLSRHYRSKHPSLIEFSNERFYQRSLICAPSAHALGEFGCILHQVDGCFLGGANQTEAGRVAAAVVDQVRRDPASSTAVIATTYQQCVAIAKAAHALDPSAYQRIELMHASSCQGIERDVIFLSLAFGPDERGVQKRSFGLFSDVDGHKALNVCLTRARKRMEVFSSIQTETVTSEARTPMRALFDFLQSGSDLNGVDEREIENSPLQRFLHLHGYELQQDAQHLLVKADGHFLAAIQLTGAMSIFDERSEKAQLENSGWSTTSLPSEILNLDRIDLDPSIAAVLKDLEDFKRKIEL